MNIPKEFLDEVVNAIKKYYNAYIDEDRDMDDEEYISQLRDEYIIWQKAFDILSKYTEEKYEISDEQNIIYSFKKYYDAHYDHLSFVSNESSKLSYENKEFKNCAEKWAEKCRVLNKLIKKLDDTESKRKEISLEKEFKKLIR